MAANGLSYSEWLVLYELHIHDQQSDSALLVSDLVDLVASSGTKINARDVAMAVGSLFDLGYVHRVSTPSGSRKWQISTSGSGYIVGSRSTSSSVTHEEPAAPFLFSDSDSEVPASDRVVTLDHNSAEHRSAITKVDEVISAVESDRTNDFEERDQIVSELKAGKTLLQSTKIRVAGIAITLGSALGFLAKKFADKLVGELASAAWTAIKTLLGL